MEALRLIVEPKNRKLVIDLPSGLDQRRLEVIIMPAMDSEPVYPPPRVRRKPSALLAGTVALKDDLIAPAVPETDWEALK